MGCKNKSEDKVELRQKIKVDTIIFPSRVQASRIRYNVQEINVGQLIYILHRTSST